MNRPDYSTAKEHLTRDKIAAALARHVGRDKSVTMTNLVFEVTGRRADLAAERRCRALITELRTEGIAVCGHPNCGYWMAANAEELEDCCAFLRHRAMTSLTLESKLRRMALPDLLNQIRIPS